MKACIISSPTDMDLLSLSPLPSLLLCTSLTLIFLFSFFTLHKHKSPRPNLPAGKTGWPIIGETLQLLLLWRKGHPENFVRERRNKYSSNIFQTSLFGENMVFFCGPAANKFLFSNENKLVATWWPRTVNKLLHCNSSVTSTPTGVKTKSVRDVVSGFLKMDVLQNYVSTMDSIAREHIEKEWEPKEGEVVVLEAVKKYTLELACQLLVGIKDQEHWVGFTDRFASVLAGIASVPIDFPGKLTLNLKLTSNVLKSRVLLRKNEVWK